MINAYLSKKAPTQNPRRVETPPFSILSLTRSERFKTGCIFNSILFCLVVELTHFKGDNIRELYTTSELYLTKIIANLPKATHKHHMLAFPLRNNSKARHGRKPAFFYLINNLLVEDLKGLHS